MSDDNVDVDRLFGLVEPCDDADESSASSFSSIFDSSNSLASNVDTSPSPVPPEQTTSSESPTTDPLDALLEQTKAYHRKRRRAEEIDTGAVHTLAPQRAYMSSAVLISTKRQPSLTSIKPKPDKSATQPSIAFPSLPPPPAPPAAVSSSHSSPRLLSDEQLLKVLTPTAYYSRTGVQDFDQVLSCNQVSAYVDLTAVAQSSDYIRVPSFALGDGGVHGPHISDHSVHKSRHDGYWEERLRKLSAQQPREEYYSGLRSFACDTPDSTAPSTAASPSYPQLFAGCRMYIDGRTEGASELSAHSLTALIRLHGGSTSPLLSRTHTTHVLATNLTLSKHMRELKQTAGMGRGRGRVQVVKPEWVRECIRQGKLLDEWPWRVVKDAQQRQLPWLAASGDESEGKIPADE